MHQLNVVACTLAIVSYKFFSENRPLLAFEQIQRLRTLDE